MRYGSNRHLPGEGVSIPVTDGARIAVVRTYRFPIGHWQWARPRSFSQSRDALTTAATALHEELGVDHLAAPRKIGAVTPDSGARTNEPP